LEVDTKTEQQREEAKRATQDQRKASLKLFDQIIGLGQYINPVNSKALD